MATVFEVLIGFCAVLTALAIILGFNLSGRWKMRHIPGPRPTFLYGALLSAPPNRLHYHLLLDLPKRYGTICKIFLGARPYVIVSDPALVEQIGTRQFMSFHDRVPLPFGVPVTGEDEEQITHNFLWAKGKFWATVRAGAEPLFHSKSLKSYSPLMHQSIDTMLAGLEKKGANAVVDVRKPLAGVTLSIVGRAAFGVDFDCQGEQESDIVSAAKKTLNPPAEYDFESFWLVAGLLLPFLRPVVAYLLRNGWVGGLNTKIFCHNEGYLNGASKVLLHNLRAKEGTSQTGKPVVDMPTKDVGPYRQVQLGGQAAGAAAYADAVPSPDSLMARMCQVRNREQGKEGEPLTDVQINSQSFTFILAGFDTITNSLMTTIYDLAKHPAAQQRLVEQVDAFFASRPNHNLSYEDLEHFSYLEAAFNESMRLHPAVNPMFLSCRVATADAVLGGYRIPKGTGVIMNSMAMAMDPKLFPDPEVFKPERFLAGNPLGPETRPPTAHIPFGYGPHSCVGKRLASFEAVVVLARFFRKFTVTPDLRRHPPGSKLFARTGITLVPEGGVWVKLHPREEAVKRPEE